MNTTSKNHALVLGDVMVDRYWHSSSSRVSPEAPVPVCDFELEEYRAGGAANVAVTLSALGLSTTLIGSAFSDAAGFELKKILLRHNIDFRAKDCVNGTTTKLRLVANNQQVARVDFNFQSDGLVVTSRDLRDVNVIVLSDYARGALSTCDKTIELAKQKSIPIIVDPKGTNWRRYSGASFLTPNLKELLNFSAVEMPGLCSDLDTIAFEAVKTLELEGLVLTRGADGMTLYLSDGSRLHYAASAVKIADVTGAGDTVVAYLAYGLVNGLSMPQCCELASRAAGVAVGKFGTSIVQMAEINPGPSKIPRSKLVNIEELKKIIASSNCKSVFTNGCFDILHRGHVEYLSEAATHGDILIVALNTDESVKKIKGNSRPINSFDERAAVLSALSSVDYIINLNSDNPRELIGELKPDVLVKGGDYKTIEEVVGWEIVNYYGGIVKLLGCVDNVSTTNLISKLRGERDE